MFQYTCMIYLSDCTIKVRIFNVCLKTWSVTFICIFIYASGNICVCIYIFVYLKIKMIVKRAFFTLYNQGKKLDWVTYK